MHKVLSRPKLSLLKNKIKVINNLMIPQSKPNKPNKINKINKISKSQRHNQTQMLQRQIQPR